MADETSYGWAGKILRVNLSTGSITTQPTDPYKEYIGGMGLANKIMYDEVPAGTDPFSPENKLIFAVGPLTASGVPLAGRTTICSLSTFTKDHLVVDAHEDDRDRPCPLLGLPAMRDDVHAEERRSRVPAHSPRARVAELQLRCQRRYQGRHLR